MPVPEIKGWASEVSLEAARLAEMGSEWRPLEAEAWQASRAKVGRLLKPMQAAISPSVKILDQACKAMQALVTLAGQTDGLRRDQLQGYLRKKPTESKSGSKKKGAGGVQRWYGQAVVQVAELVKKQWPALRAAMRLDMPIEDVPTSVEVIVELKADLAKTETKLKASMKRAATAENNHQHAAKRLKLKNKAVTDARKDERRKAKVATQAEKSKRLTQAKAARIRDSQIYKAAAEKEVAGDLEGFKKQLAAARKRARDVKNVAKLAGKRLKRAKAAEKALTELQALLEKVQEPEEESEDEETPATAEGSRRDARGRWLAEAWQLRVLKWAQLARRTPPSAVARNISDVLAAVGAPQSYDPTERQLKLMRSELTHRR